jgi:hypothetical protein
MKSLFRVAPRDLAAPQRLDEILQGVEAGKNAPEAHGRTDGDRRDPAQSCEKT